MLVLGKIQVGRVLHWLGLEAGFRLEELVRGSKEVVVKIHIPQELECWWKEDLVDIHKMEGYYLATESEQVIHKVVRNLVS